MRSLHTPNLEGIVLVGFDMSKNFSTASHGVQPEVVLFPDRSSIVINLH